MAAERVIGEVRLKEVRLSFADIFRAKAVNNDPESQPRFSANFLIDLETPQGRKNDKAIKAAIDEIKVGKWAQNIPKLKPEKLAYRDGSDEDWDGYEGVWYVAANNKRKPVIVDRNPGIALTEADGRPYSGCYVNAVVRFWAQDDKDYGKRINCSLEAIQFVKDGEAFGAKPVNAEEVFEDLGDDEDEDTNSLV